MSTNSSTVDTFPVIYRLKTVELKITQMLTLSSPQEGKHPRTSQCSQPTLLSSALHLLLCLLPLKLGKKQSHCSMQSCPPHKIPDLHGTSADDTTADQSLAFRNGLSADLSWLCRCSWWKRHHGQRLCVLWVHSPHLPQCHDVSSAQHLPSSVPAA